MSIVDPTTWEQYLKKFPEAHILQTRAWGEVKAAFGWFPHYVCNERCGAQILFRRLPLGLTIAYIPKGPVGEDWTSLWSEVDVLCQKKRAIFLKVEPDEWEDSAADYPAWMQGFLPDKSTIQPRRTIVINLEGSPDDWLERMKPKHRYNTRLAGKKDVVVRQVDEVSAFYQLMRTTGERNTFGVHSEEYYRRVLEAFSASGEAALFLAEFQDKPLAGLVAMRHGKRAWYFYGASSNEERQRMPAYLLQFEAMKWAKAAGCETYDLWGIPDEEEEVLEAKFETRNDGLWGVYRFKRGFGGKIMRSAPAWEKIYQPVLYNLYTWYQGRRGGLNG